MANKTEEENKQLRRNQEIRKLHTRRIPSHEINQNANRLLFLDFWGPVSNFGIPIAAVMDTQKDAEMYVTIL